MECTFCPVPISFITCHAVFSCHVLMSSWVLSSCPVLQYCVFLSCNTAYFLSVMSCSLVFLSCPPVLSFYHVLLYWPPVLSPCLILLACPPVLSYFIFISGHTDLFSCFSCPQPCLSNQIFKLAISPFLPPVQTCTRPLQQIKAIEVATSYIFGTSQGIPPTLNLVWV